MAESKELETLVYCLGQIGGEHNPVITSGSGFDSKYEYTTKGYARYIKEANNMIKFMNLIINYFLASVKSEFEEDPLAFIDSESEEDSLASIQKMKKQWRDMFKEHQRKLREALRNQELEEFLSTPTPSIEESSNNSKQADEDSSEESSGSSAKIPRLYPEAPELELESTSEAGAKAPEVELESTSEAGAKAPEMELESTSEAGAKAPEVELESTSEATAKAPEMELESTSEAGAKAPEMELESTSEATAKAPEMELESTSEAGAKAPEMEPESISELGAKCPESDLEAISKASSVGVPVESLEFPQSIFLRKMKEFGGVMKTAYQELRSKMGKALNRISPDHTAHDLKGFTLQKMEKFAKWKYAIKTLNYLVPELESKLGELDLDFDKRKENENRLTDWMYFDDGKRDRKYHHRILIPMELTVSIEEISAIIWRQMRRYRKIKKSLQNQLPQEYGAFNVQVAHWKYEVLYNRPIKKLAKLPASAQSDDTYCCVEEMPVDI